MFKPGDLAWFRTQGIIVEIAGPSDPSYVYTAVCGTNFLVRHPSENSFHILSLGKAFKIMGLNKQEFLSMEASVKHWTLVPLKYQEGWDETLSWKSVPKKDLV